MYLVNLDFQPTTRFDLRKFVEVDPDSGIQDATTSAFFSEIKTLKRGGDFTVAAFENRPDLISFMIYKSTQYWWIILVYNDLVSPENLVPGMIIHYPALKDLERLYFDLNSRRAALERTS